MLHVPVNWFLALLNSELAQVVVGIDVGRALADLLLTCYEVFVAFQYVSCHLQVHDTILALHCQV